MAPPGGLILHLYIYTHTEVTMSFVPEMDKHVKKRPRTIDEEEPRGESGILTECPEYRPEEEKQIEWRTISGEQLNLTYTRLFQKKVADRLFDILERDVEYLPEDQTRVKVFGKWHSIPSRRVAYGDHGLTYSFSGTKIAAKEWLTILSDLRSILLRVTGHRFNFVLINRYADGNDHIGEHRDDEKELARGAPIASISFGQERDFVLRHRDARGGGARRRHVAPVKLLLEHGSLLMMHAPTNHYWYHSLPVRKRALHPRVNLTFRVMTS